MRNRYIALIPAYEPEQRLAGLTDDLKKRGFDVVVVDDGSGPDYRALFEELAQKATVLTHAKNRGKGIALRTGLEEARRLGYRFALTIDADGQHDPGDIPALVAAAGEKTLVIGSRNIAADGMSSGSTFANKLSNFWFTVKTGRKLPDTQTG